MFVLPPLLLLACGLGVQPAQGRRGQTEPEQSASLSLSWSVGAGSAAELGGPAKVLAELQAQAEAEAEADAEAETKVQGRGNDKGLGRPLEIIEHGFEFSLNGLLGLYPAGSLFDFGTEKALKIVSRKSSSSDRIAGCSGPEKGHQLQRANGLLPATAEAENASDICGAPAGGAYRGEDLKVEERKLVSVSDPAGVRKALRPEARKALKEKSAWDFHKRYGDFYATQVTLGGALMATFVTNTLPVDEAEAALLVRKVDQITTLPKIMSELNPLGHPVAGSSSVAQNIEGHKCDNVNCMVVKFWQVLGGDKAPWLQNFTEGHTKAKAEKQWAQSLDKEHRLIPVHYKLEPIWRLVEAEGYPDKAAKLKEYLENALVGTENPAPSTTSTTAVVTTTTTTREMTSRTVTTTTSSACDFGAGRLSWGVLYILVVALWSR